MKFLLAILLTAALAFLAGLYSPWWSIAVIAFLVALLVKQPYGVAFVSGFAGIFLCWGLLAFWIDIKNNHNLSHKIAQIIPLGGSPVLLILVTALVGALVGGFAAASGSSLRQR
ncbi:hypothetical protein [Flavisolibacter ginsenosidimutans]|uniref:Uncharacterized protein n=1 Tax=Flavisolibacter ginsenosidimutans TaxID=661481 RepID=A0A5B8UE76_9BACT|nr:hypothetical protein [Flavisolibacter ginsenosidimutans]QEC54818.1 hypothetical protein FSB75_02505 [Flavisolibacter ginsenosidimutans]